MNPGSTGSGLGLQTLGYLLERGMPLHDALIQSARVTRSRKLRQAWRRMGARLRRGETYAQAVEGEKKRLPPGLAELMGVGIETGTIGSVLASLATHQELRWELRSSIRRTMLPVLPLLLATLVTGWFFYSYFVHGFIWTYQNLGLETPWHLRSDVLPLIWLAPALVGLVLAGIGLYWGGAGRPMGSVRRLASWSLLTRGLGLLLEAGVPLHTALGYLATAGLPDLAGGLEAGESLEGSLEGMSGVPESLRSILAQGEETGRLPEVCAELGLLYRRLAMLRVRWIARRLAPALFGVAALMAGLTVLAGYQLYYKTLTDVLEAVAS